MASVLRFDDWETTLGTSVAETDGSGNVALGGSSPSYRLDVTGDINASADLRIGGTAVGRWVDYSGSQTFSGISIGNGTVASYYAQIGDVVFMRGQFTMGSTSTLSGPVDMSIPVTANSANVSVHWGESCMFRGSGNWLGNMLCVSTTSYRFINLYVSGSNVLARDIGTNTPFTWTTTNRITWSYSYRAA